MTQATGTTLDPTVRCDRSDHWHHSLDEARACWRSEQPHGFALARYPDGTTYEILDGKVGSNGKWYAYPVCADCGKRKGSKIHN